MWARFKLWLSRRLRCKHKRFVYKLDGGTCCPNCLTEDWDRAECSRPVYKIICYDCKEQWTVSEDDVIDFFARPLPEEMYADYD